MKLQLGISTCPNDIFAFHAILKRKIDLGILDLSIRLLDVQELNSLVSRRELDCSKVSFFAALYMAEDYFALPVGAALGQGVGPLVLQPSTPQSARPNARVLCPGELTTAHLLFRKFFPEYKNIQHCIFSEIMPRLNQGLADLGVVIHEGRFTYREAGLSLFADLADYWQSATDLPLPLGGIVAKRNIPKEVLSSLIKVIRESISYAHSHPDEVFETMQHYAQELQPEVIWQHVELYVNDFTLDLGAQGRSALGIMREMAIETKLLADNSLELEVI